MWLARLTLTVVVSYHQEQVRSLIRLRLRCQRRDQNPLFRLQCPVYIKNVEVVWGRHKFAGMNKRRSRMDAAQNWAMKQTVAAASDRANTVRCKLLQMHVYLLCTNIGKLQSHNFNSKACIKDLFRQLSSFDPFCVLVYKFSPQVLQISMNYSNCSLFFFPSKQY